MSSRLKEDPKEWFKFTAAMAVAADALAILLWNRQVLSRSALAWVLVLVSSTPLVCLVRPAWFRSFYRIGSSVGLFLGQCLAAIMLMILFWLVLTPTGLLLRVLGKDLLALKKNKSAATYWLPARVSDRFDRQF